MRTNHPKRKAPQARRKKSVSVDLALLRSVEHRCRGCASDEPSCCSSFEVCVTGAEMKRIIQVLPEAAKLCPHLKAGRGYDNVFEYVESGLYALDTTEDGLCLLWPLCLSEGGEALSLAGDALTFRCTAPRGKPANGLSPAFVKAVGHVYGKRAGARRAALPRRS